MPPIQPGLPLIELPGPARWVGRNGQIVSAAEAVVSVFDRGFLYGDGLFETVRVYNGRPFRWQQHLDRLERGAEFLQILLPWGQAALTASANALLHRNALPESLLRVTVTRGVAQRGGYSFEGTEQPQLVMTQRPAPAVDPNKPPRWCLVTTSFRVPTYDRVSLYKTTNKVLQILARHEAERRGADEALVLNTDSEIAEGASCNLFWVRDGVVGTPPLTSGILSGITRALVLELCRTLGIPCQERAILPDAIRHADAIFVTLSSLGIVEVAELDGRLIGTSPIVAQLRDAYAQVIQQETGEGTVSRLPV